MFMKMEIEVNEEELCELVKAEVVRQFGPPPKGYHLEARRYYSDVKVSTVKDAEPEPAPEPAQIATIETE